MQHSDISFSELQTKRVVDADGVRVGAIIDVRFDEEGSTWFVLGGGFVQQTLQKLHIRPNIDLLVPAEWIASIGSDEIVLRRSLFQLESTCQECWEREKDRLVAEAAPSHRDQQSVLRLTDPRII
ncbi:MAG: PRC-barrel domain-containing protein [Acidimicrobiia bacterium]|nr:PRC-barrel domain-containing protein [Acidimicrobiia bacterium]